MINSNIANLQSTSRQPRAIVQINNLKSLWQSIDIRSQNYFLSDRFTVTIPLNNNPPFDIYFWSSITTSDIKIFQGFPPNPVNYTTSDLIQIFGGQIDVIKIDPVHGLVTITGRDYSSLLIDKKETNLYVNQTASQVATLLAQENGLTPIVTATTTPIGNYYNNYTKLSQDTTQWDLLTFLAQQENFNVFVINRNLYFQPKPTAKTAPYFITYEPAVFGFSSAPVSVVTDIEFGRTLTLAQDVEVRVLSYNQLTATTIHATAKSHHVKGGLVTRTQTYVFNIPNLTSAQANAKAQNLVQTISMAELLLNATLPADTVLTKNMPIKILSSQSVIANQVFYPDLIERNFDVRQGFTMTINAKNHDTNTQVTVQ